MKYTNHAPSFSCKFVLSSPTYLPLIMLLNIPYRLWQSPRSAVQVIRMGCFVLMEYHTVPFCRIICIMQIPVVPGISGLHRYIMFTQHNNVKILGAYLLKLSCIKHQYPPLWQTRKPMPVPKLPVPLPWTCP